MRRSILWSLVGHLIVFLLMVIWELTHKQNHEMPAQAIQVQPISEAEFQKRLRRELDGRKNEKQIVQIDPQLKSSKAPSENEAKYLSSHDQLVDKETRAQKVGKFKNVLNEGNPETLSKNKKFFELSPTKPQQQDREPSSVVSGRLRKPANLDGPQGDGESATDDYLEDVAIGAQTLLNAKEFKFYSFYARIREKLSERWQIKLREEIPLLESQGTPISSTTRRTSVRIFLSPSGQLQKVQLLESSGLQGLDRAATEAFRLSAPFPNPPQAMIGDDGLVSIKWDFVVVADDNQNVQFTVQRTGYR